MCAVVCQRPGNVDVRDCHRSRPLSRPRAITTSHLLTPHRTPGWSKRGHDGWTGRSYLSQCTWTWNSRAWLRRGYGLRHNLRGDCFCSHLPDGWAGWSDLGHGSEEDMASGMTSGEVVFAHTFQTDGQGGLGQLSAPRLRVLPQRDSSHLQFDKLC